MPYPPAPPINGLGFAKEHNDTYQEINPATQSHCNGRAAFITGASKGVGRATAISYALAGASHLALAARSDLTSLKSDIEARCRTVNKTAPTILTLTLDVRDEMAISQAAERVALSFGRLDILYNNAGYLEKGKPIADSEPSEWWYTWETNMRGVYLVTRAFLPLLLKTQDGLKTIVNSSSIGAHNLRYGGSSYQCSKLAIARFSEFIMSEYADQGVLCYCIQPGRLMTELGRNLPEYMHKDLQDTPELAADALVYLTQEKRDWLAGRYISLTWDIPEILSRQKEIVEGDKLKVRLVL